ncbi:hypothetical protein OPT61_g4975 [Boeremia exigua]|uniref:Uncharacterized protein n=1 Tax=Boeremia exigua TaxID=749465 RepID=A0ACC2IBY4_9PLEO|nr:hypothetical protein OPT61_g4975 [Boeremia exigua]
MAPAISRPVKVQDKTKPNAYPSRRAGSSSSSSTSTFLVSTGRSTRTCAVVRRTALFDESIANAPIDMMRVEMLVHVDVAVDHARLLRKFFTSFVRTFSSPRAGGGHAQSADRAGRLNRVLHVIENLPGDAALAMA